MLNTCLGLVSASTSANEAMKVACTSVRNAAFEHESMKITIPDWRNNNSICGNYIFCLFNYLGNYFGIIKKFARKEKRFY